LLVYGTTGYQFDPQGNATHLMDDDGLVVAHLAYDAWGQRMSGNNPTPYGYKGQWGYYTDGETGVLLLTHRYLDPATGRFLTRDPIGVEGGINLYAYVGNGVVIGSDRSGLKLEFCTRPVGPCDQHNAKFCHWFFASTECGCVGYGPQGPHDDCSEHFGKKEHWCKRVNTTPSQERCICENFRNAQKGWKMCGEQWLPKGGKEGAYNWLDHNCQHFIICLARKCGVKYPFPPSLTPYHPKVY
jgi:RHS repeat-associated protein